MARIIVDEKNRESKIKTFLALSRIPTEKQDREYF